MLLERQTRAEARGFSWGSFRVQYMTTMKNYSNIKTLSGGGGRIRQEGGAKRGAGIVVGVDGGASS